MVYPINTIYELQQRVGCFKFFQTNFFLNCFKNMVIFFLQFIFETLRCLKKILFLISFAWYYFYLEFNAKKTSTSLIREPDKLWNERFTVDWKIKITTGKNLKINISYRKKQGIYLVPIVIHSFKNCMPVQFHIAYWAMRYGDEIILVMIYIQL